MTQFVHLHVHSEYSLREGALRIADAIEAAVEMQMPALAITDTNAMYGAVTFYKAAKAAGVNPILGVQLTVGKDEDVPILTDARPGHVNFDTAVLLAENFKGYQNLVRLVTIAHERTRMPFVTFSELGRHADSVIALVGGGESISLRLFAADRHQEAETWLNQWFNTWPAQSLFIDVQDHGIPEERKGLPALIRYARSHQLPLVASNDVHYMMREEADVQRVLAQIEGTAHARVLQGDRYELASPAEMMRRFTKLPEAVENTLRIAERCQVELPLHQTLQPKYPTPSGEPANVVLRRAAEVGAKQRYGTLSASIRERLDYELSVIERLGFADYFLVVADFIRFAHKQGISTGPGRGSAAGSLIAYALRITDVDPIQNKLLFERFLNPERVSWPDIDTDFEFERRNEVIAYVIERYGREHVAQIGTFGTLAARAAIRDAGRALSTDPKLVDRLAKLIPGYPGVTLKKALEEVTAIGDLLRTNQHAKQLWDVAAAIEGLPRHTSVHAAGVVISPVPLSDLIPVQPGGDGTPVTQYAMEDIERLGLMKMDFLGLRTLTLIDACVASIERRTGQAFDWRRVSDTDEQTFVMLSRGETEGCFQLESSGFKRMLRELKPTNLEDIVAAISLYRPGPMENIPTFIAAKHGRTQVHYPHPDLEPILKDTYGVIVYQEQVMQIASRMGGFTLGQADLLRKAVGKKQRDVLDAQRSRFVMGCKERGYDDEVANDVYDLIVRFADYGFNRSHAAAYAVLAYRTAYLRAHHLADFLASLLSMVIGASEKAAEYERDAKQHRIQVLKPCVARSEALYVVEDEHSIRTGLLAVRNVGRGAVEAILAARAAAPFTSLVDFLQRVNSRACNRKAVESLLAAGAFAPFLPDKATPEAAAQILEEAYQVAEERKQTQGLGLSFDDGAEEQTVLYIRYLAEERSSNLSKLRGLLAEYPGSTPVALFDSGRRKVRMLEAKWSVTVTPELIASLEETVGLGNARLGKRPDGRTKTAT